MIWCSGWELASAVSNAGGLGIIGSGSMYPDVLLEPFRKCKAATSRPFAVNIPMLYPDVDKHIQTVIEEGVPIVFTSAGNPGTWTRKLKDAGIIDGDLLAVHRTTEARQDQIVVARIDDEVTVKRLHRTRECHIVELLPENADFAPLRIDMREHDFTLEGISVGVLRLDT